jgi:hypothetical protein
LCWIDSISNRKWGRRLGRRPPLLPPTSLYNNSWWTLESTGPPLPPPLPIDDLLVSRAQMT